MLKIRLAGALLAGAAAAALLLPAPAQADENRVVKCKTWRAKWDGKYSGPALVANVPRSMTPIDLNAVQMTDKALTKTMIVESMAARRTETETLEVMARLVNCTKKPIQVDARTSFMDGSQMPTEAASAWRRVFLPPYATGVYQESSIGRKKVEHFLIEVRGAGQVQYR